MIIDELKVLISAPLTGFKQDIKQATSTTKQFSNEAAKQMNSFNRNIKQATSTTKKFGDGVTKQTKIASSGFKNLGNMVKYALTAVVVRQVARGITAVTKLASSVVESENLFKVSMGSMASEARAWSEQLANALGLNAYDIRENIGLLYNMAASMGVAGDAAYLVSKNLTQLSNDMASYYNVSTSDMMEKIQAGMTGESEPLKRLGVIVNETTIKQTALKHGIISVGQTMTEQQKYIARYITIMESTQKAHGDLARTIDSPANQMRILSNNIKMAGKALGDFFLPFVQVTLPYVNALTVSVKNLFTTMASWSRALFGLKDAGETAGEATETAYAGVADGISDTVSEAKKAVAGFDELNNLSSTSSEMPTVGTSIGIDLPTFELPEEIKTKADEIRQTFSDIWNSEGMEPWRNTLSNIGDILGDIFDVGKNIYDNIVAPIIEPVVGVAFQGIGLSLEVISSSVETITKCLSKIDWDKWSPMLIGIAGGLAAIYGPALLIKGLIKPLISGWQTIALTFLCAGDTIKSLIMGINPTVLAIGALITIGILLWKNWDKVKVKALEVWGSIQACFFRVIAGFKVAFPEAYGFIKGIVDGVRTVLNGLLIFITGAFTRDWTTIWTGVKVIFEGIFKSLWTITATIFNLIIKNVNWVIKQLNKINIKMPDILGGGRFGFDIPTMEPLPTKLARGGIVSKPTYTMMGENNKKEMVVPLENTSFVDKLASALGSAVLAAMNVSQAQTAAPSSGGDIVLAIDGREFARVANPYLVKEEKRLGRTKVIERR